ncbi:hypothetical protein ACFYPB_36725 [Streptomyces olivaceoviridis]|uniref:hypothetical protein n=1 Tax=Streptomyces olivaceoviridis TaxID=1921 RepID=UPI00369088A0
MARTMAEKVELRLKGEKLPGERVLYGVLAFRIGGVRTTMIGGAAGLAGAAGAAAMAAITSRGRAAAPDVPLQLPGRIIIALTDQRLLVLSVGGVVVGKPGKLLHSFALDQVAWVGEPELIPGVAQALRVQIGIAEVGVLAFEHPRLQVTEGRNMIKRLIRELPQA